MRPVEGVDVGPAGGAMHTWLSARTQLPASAVGVAERGGRERREREAREREARERGGGEREKQVTSPSPPKPPHTLGCIVGARSSRLPGGAMHAWLSARTQLPARERDLH